MASNPQTFQPFGRPLANSSGFFAQRDTEQQLHGLFSGLNLGTRAHPLPFSTPAAPAAGPSEDIELNDVRPVEKKLTTKQLRKARAAEKTANTTKKPKIIQTPKVNKQKRAKIRFERRKSQKDRLDAINRDPHLIEQRLQALKKLHACAQDLHNATENKIELKQTLRNLTDSLAAHTEKNADELYAELCQSNNQKSAEILVEGKIKGLKRPDGSFENFVKNLDKPVPPSVPQPTSRRLTQQKERDKRHKEVKAGVIQPKFKLLAPSREQKIKNSQNWKRAGPLILDLCEAIASGGDINISQSYAQARVPIKNLADGLERGFEEVLSEVIPSFTRERIAYFEQPFIALEEADKPVLPDISHLGFNDGIDQSISTWREPRPELC